MFTAQEDPLQLAFMVASVMNLEAAREQALLEADHRVEALRMVHGLAVARSGSAGAAQQDHRRSARPRCRKEQREYMLRQQKQAIEQELGEKNPRSGRGRRNCARNWPRPICPEDVRKEAERELGRLEKACRRRSRSTT